jgi:hypothetical protein
LKATLHGRVVTVARIVECDPRSFIDIGEHSNGSPGDTSIEGDEEASVLQLAAKQLGLRAKVEEGQQESLIARPFALCQ